jgi:hypothetical protein
MLSFLVAEQRSQATYDRTGRVSWRSDVVLVVQDSAYQSPSSVSCRPASDMSGSKRVRILKPVNIDCLWRSSRLLLMLPSTRMMV